MTDETKPFEGCWIMPEAKCYAMQVAFWNVADGPTPGDTTCAIAGMDGSWWVDWAQIEKMAAIEPSSDPNHWASFLLPRLLLAARGRLTEVTRERADEIALEYGAKFQSPVEVRR